MKNKRFDKRKYILIGLVLGIIVLLLILNKAQLSGNIIKLKGDDAILNNTQQFGNVIELKGDDLTYCKELRAELYADYSVNERALDEDDRIFLYDYKDKLCEKYNIKCEEYVLDMQSCAFFLKEDARLGLVKEYRDAKE